MTVFNEVNSRAHETKNFNKWLFEVFCEFDYLYARPLLVYDFPNVVEMHDKITKNIKNLKNLKKDEKEIVKDNEKEMNEIKE